MPTTDDNDMYDENLHNGEWNRSGIEMIAVSIILSCSCIVGLVAIILTR